MRIDRDGAIRLVLVGCAVWVWLPCARAGSPESPTNHEGAGFFVQRSPDHSLGEGLPLDAIHAAYRDKVAQVISQPTLHTRGPVEVFRGQPQFYHWLLDHPDQAVLIWRRLGARCTDITQRGRGRFGYTDRQGSDIAWETVLSTPTQRVWFAEGVATPGMLVPAAPVRAVVILRYHESLDPLGRTLIHHQAELYMQTDGRALSLMARLVGNSAPRLAEQCVGQMEIFFSALVWYLDRHPERIETLLLGALPANSPALAELQQAFGAAQFRNSSYNASKFVTQVAE
jgi:hypothetical protein